MSSNTLKFSIVTPSYNQAAFLEQTMRSVLEQDYPSVEYIVIDGGSQDGSIDIIRKYEHRLAYWTSEPDRGPGDAINKGFRRATGDIFAWLNSDDFLLPGALQTVARVFQTTAADLVYGDNLHVDEHGWVKDCGMLPSMPPRALLLYAMGCFHQEASFWRAERHRQVGQVNVDLFPGFDIDWFLRMVSVPGFQYQYLRIPLGVAREHPAQNIAAIRDGDPQALRKSKLARRNFIEQNLVPGWKLAVGGLYYGAWRRFHEAYTRRLGWRYVFHLPHLSTIKRVGEM